MRKEEMSWVYFAQRPDGDIKIGTIVKHFFTQRMWNLWRQNGSIRVLGVIEGGFKKESELHDRFHESRRRSTKMPERRIYTEYFAPTPALLEFIKDNSIDLKLFKPRGGNFKLDYFGWNSKEI